MAILKRIHYILQGRKQKPRNLQNNNGGKIVTKRASPWYEPFVNISWDAASLNRAIVQPCNPVPSTVRCEDANPNA
jgi:hypothetical protein